MTNLTWNRQGQDHHQRVNIIIMATNHAQTYSAKTTLIGAFRTFTFLWTGINIPHLQIGPTTIHCRNGPLPIALL